MSCDLVGGTDCQEDLADKDDRRSAGMFTFQILQFFAVLLLHPIRALVWTWTRVLGSLTML